MVIPGYNELDMTERIVQFIDAIKFSELND